MSCLNDTWSNIGRTVERPTFSSRCGDIFREACGTLRHEAEAGKVTGLSGLNQQYWTSISKTLIYGMNTGAVMGHTGLEEWVVAVCRGVLVTAVSYHRCFFCHSFLSPRPRVASRHNLFQVCTSVARGIVS